MKNISSFRLALVFAGSFLGAGYVSGQELFQYFGCYGKKGFIGFFITAVLLFLFGSLILVLTRKSGIYEADTIVCPWNNKPIRSIVATLEMVFLFAVISIMVSGVGSLVHDFFKVPEFLGSAVFCAVLFLCSFKDIKGFISAFSVSVPLLCITVIIICAVTLIKGGFPEITGETVNKNSLLGGFLVSSVNFSCYNTFACIAIIAPLGKIIGSNKTVFKGLSLGAVIASAVAVCVLLTLFSYKGSENSELPMLYVCGETGFSVKCIYGILLFLAMFGTSLSSFVSVVNFFRIKSPVINGNKKLFAFVLTVLIFLASLVGFGELIGFVYPLFGYACAVFVVMMAVHLIKLTKSEKSKSRKTPEKDEESAVRN